ncbi:enoyl-CoA hydratase/isomerase family protein [Jiella sonneratiae]|uniref:Enoyl-CoA hydratase/isomerase family protein n=1 Tax=Jiella sonneratiae TaxID=2816856 RepID=A0ABS3J881_9HYPH|nr:enoyl-CoA hydratase/isomerase family protein [Jiella sonneratiae]MBO0905874.1 enoyl-CoA hydratase/isomerase family protein [Jiella sonneratiae]
MSDESEDRGEEGDRLCTLSLRGAIAEITLCSGPLNLVTRPFLRQLNAHLRTLADRTDIRCVILHGGAGRAFCAGSDIREFEALRDGTASERKILFEDMVLRSLALLPVPTIAAIDAPAFGGGLELALACDIRVLKAGIGIGLTESRLGGLAGNGAVRLARLVGPARAKEMLFTGMVVDAATALDWGIVNSLAETGSALDRARTMAATIAGRGPVSNRLAKRLVDAALDEPLDAALARSTRAQQQIFDSADLHEGAAAFFAKREPEFTNG